MAYCVTTPKPLSNPMRTSDLVRLCGIYMGVMSQRVPKVLICIMNFMIILNKFQRPMRLKNIDIFQWCVSDIFARYQWLKHEHPDELIKYSFAWIPAMFLLVLTYYKIQGLYHWLLHIVLGDYINRHKTIQRGSQSTQHMLCGHEKPSRTSIICNYHQGIVYAPMYMDIPVSRHRQLIALHSRIKLECNKKSNTLIFSETSRHHSWLKQNPRELLQLYWRINILTRLAVDNGWWEIDIYGRSSIVKIAFASIWTCKNNRRI